MCGMRRALPLAAVVIVALGLLIAFGPARVRPWECRDRSPATTARGAVDAYYAACWRQPTVQEPPTDLGAGAAGNAGEGYGGWGHLVEYTVRYDDGRRRFLLIGQRRAGERWQLLQGEGTAP